MGRLGGLLARLEGVLGRLGGVLGRLGGIFVRPKNVLEASWADLGASWAVGASPRTAQGRGTWHAGLGPSPCALDPGLHLYIRYR